MQGNGRDQGRAAPEEVVHLIERALETPGLLAARQPGTVGISLPPIESTIMQLTIFAAGSRGDIQPCVTLGHGLRQAGFAVRLAAPANFAGFVQERGLAFHPLGGDVQQIMASDAGRRFMERGGGNPLASIRAMRTLLGPVALQMAEDALAACAEAEALISLAVFAPFAQPIAALRRIPLILVEPTPLLPTGAFPAPGWPLQRDLGALPNRLSGVAMLQVLWQWYRPFVNDFRRRHGLPPSTGADFYRTLTANPLLGAYSPAVIPRPSDWPDGARPTGYWSPDTPLAWHPPPALEAFLARGAAPVYVGFGSMAGRRPEQLARLVLEALARSGQRGVLLTGWGGIQALDVPDTVLVIDSVPHSWLFPQMAAVVHHGGAGTTGEGLRAGAPTVIVPFVVDQPFWGQRVRALGVGPAPLPQRTLTAAALAEAIAVAVHDTGIRKRAAALGATLRAEDGVSIAVSRIKRYLRI
jgi:sterol 3beta-glucosyltransferase